VLRVALWMLAALLCGLWAAIAPRAHAQSRGVCNPTIPRFVSLKRSKTNVRVGPGKQYPVRWIYQLQGLPIEIIAEFGNWRRVRGSDGSEGWVHSALLSTRRMALAAPWSTMNINLRAGPRDRAATLARLQPGVLVRIMHCDVTWCAVSVPGHDLSGYVRQVKVWGVYPDETI